MINELSILKGIHPGFVLERKLKERKLENHAFALSIGEYLQTINAITKGKRGMNTPLALKIEHVLGLEEGYFMTLQIFYEIKGREAQTTEKYPSESVFDPQGIVLGY